MKTCPKCGREMADEEQNCPNCGFEMSRMAQQVVPRPRAVPNIPRREPDSLPERPEGAGSSSNKGTLILVIALVILVLVIYFWMKK